MGLSRNCRSGRAGGRAVLLSRKSLIDKPLGFVLYLLTSGRWAVLVVVMVSVTDQRSCAEGGL